MHFRAPVFVASPSSLAWVVVVAVTVSTTPIPLHAEEECMIACNAVGSLEAFEVGNLPGDTPSEKCFSKYCAQPILLGDVSYSLDDPTCDPNGPLECDITATSNWHFPGVGDMTCFPGLSINGGWRLNPNIWCGLDVSGTLHTDLGMAVAHYSATCENPGNVVLQAIVCQGLGSCQRQTNVPLDISSSALCNPRPNGCGEGDAGAGMCCFGPAGGSSPDGSPPGFGIPGTNAHLVYQAEGVGHPGTPGSSTWIAVSGLGRYWIHEFATRIVSSSPYSTAWLITPGGTFRRFIDANTDGYSEDAVPSDEFRTLEHDLPASGQWQLTDLDGTVTVFNSDGSWQSTTDRLGNAWTASYSGGLLDTVSFPDGREEIFTYAGGRLSTVQQVGLEDDDTQAMGSQADCTSDSECRTWTYTWNGDDLEQLTYPDGTARKFYYGGPSHPGYMTRLELLNVGGTVSRVEAAWEYTDGGRIYRTWKGADTWSDAAAVEKYEFSSYDSESQPTAVDVTDPFGQVASYTIGYDTDSVKPRLESISGQCPSCGGPDDQYEYDPSGSMPLLPTARIDGNGHRTELTYNANGTVATRTEAAMTSQVRTTTFDYDPNFLGLRTLEQRPSTSGSGDRETVWSYDGTSGVLLSRTISGDETTYDADGDGIPEGSFSLTTEYSGHNGAGQPGTIDPPGGGTADATTFTYAAPGRNGLLADSRTDPLVGTTIYGYDGLNRRSSVIDPNGVETRTEYNRLDRVEQVTQAANTTETLVTTYAYNAYGDLDSVTDPKGHVTAYEYDDAGRLTAIRRQDGATVAVGDERTHFTLNSFGQHTREEEQVWDGSAWQTKSATRYDYSSRCYLDRVVHDPDDGATEVTEYDYDCDRKLAAVWDAEHPSASHPPSQVYVYDELDRLSQVREPWVPDTDCRGVSAPAGCAVTTYGYDVQDHLTLVTDAENNTTGYLYSDRDRMTYEASPVSGMTVHRYDDHGELVETTDARNVTVTRTLDDLDRVTEVDYPGTALDTSYTYDTAPTSCPVGSSYPIGRLSSISRGGAAVDSCYDRFGRTTRDGDLTYTYDDNGNVETIAYPGDVNATYGYDLADRPVSLSVTTPSGTETVASGGAYRPAGPLTGLSFGNGTSEARDFTNRYFPKTITWTGANVRTWTYAEDHVGNITSITGTSTCAGETTVANQTLSGAQTIESCADLILGPALTLDASADIAFRAAGAVRIGNGFSVAAGGQMSVESGATVEPPPEVRAFGYQDGPYFLTQADGPWGERDWTYDRIGNRTSETRDRSGANETDSYTYETNGSGNTPLLGVITLSPTGTADYEWDSAGNLDTLDRGANHLDATFDAASRLARLERNDAMDPPTIYAAADFLYDGRGFLRQGTDPDSGRHRRAALRLRRPPPRPGREGLPDRPRAPPHPLLPRRPPGGPAHPGQWHRDLAVPHHRPPRHPAPRRRRHRRRHLEQRLRALRPRLR